MSEVSAREADGLVYASLAQLLRLEQPAQHLGFSSRQPLGSILAGQHNSRLRGRGLNFEELRRYQPGDDLRHIDWRVSLRQGKPFVRSFSEERDRPALILVDQRMDMFFGSKRSLKSCTAAELAALAAWMVFHSGDRVGGLVFNDQQIERIAPLRSRQRIEQLCAVIIRQNHALAADNPDIDSRGQLDKVLHECLALANHDHLICIISDFAGTTPQTLKLLRQLAAHNDVIALQVYDPIALSIPQNGHLLITQGELQVELAVGRKQVHKPLSAFSSGRLREVAELLRRSRIPLLMISTGEETLPQLRFELGKYSGPSR
ncbi:Protein of unknown function DUF58 [Pseudomonas pohangensis]|jgi:uncharacterized protein (DUF58 family)|uniref:DUF58 domain-containing protein n=1 Tax=Pseudomonas pohangensis TaxID=364197 RepID=A0A1H2FS42_9PSED|nr:DUF58 domain-containing protein [Pseudomonas pohangensis]SDU10145.1 Protein of unknown function DUF58 [Pseudomonas pohangensis]